MDFALITESWLKDGGVLDKDVVDLEYGTGLKIIYRNRPKRAASARTVGGGVSIVYRGASCNFRERRVSGCNYELVIAVGRVSKIDRPVMIICLYVQPKMRVAELDNLRGIISDQVLQAKISMKDPIFFIGGDLNRRDLAPAFENFIEIRQRNFEPTRGAACLDVMYSNLELCESVWPPLESLDGTKSDHSCVVLCANEARKKDFTWIKKVARKHTEAACVNFSSELLQIPWSTIVTDDLDVDTMVARFESKISEMTDRLFPKMTVRCRSNEDPWITDGIRRMAGHKKRVYKREGKSSHWITLRDRVLQMTERSKQAFLNKTEKAGPRQYYSAVKKLSGPGKPPDWNIMSMFPDKTIEEVGDTVSAYYTRITDQFHPLEEGNTSGPLRRPATLQEVIAMLKKAKKPNSTVKGDVLPRLMKRYYGLLAAPIQTIYNKVFETGVWPKAWKEETTVVIPKVSNPGDLADCRNISCTAFLSKVLEMFVLEDLRSEIPADQRQYGGIKACSVDHLLVDMHEAILRPLDDGDPVVVMGIDFEKAFNRLDHRQCLIQLRALGASEATIRLVRAFLTGRSMRVRIGDFLSAARSLKGGSPQGSILGCLLYCLTTQHIGPAPPADPGTINQDGSYPVTMVKYVDDTTLVERVDKESTVKHFSTQRTKEQVPAPGITGALRDVRSQADDIGMRVNCRKTQVLCISSDNGCDSSVTIPTPDGDINSVAQIKLLGYTIGNKPGAHAHVEAIKAKFRRSIWSIFHLRRAGMRGSRLFTMYSVFVRPLLEANSVVCGPMMTEQHAQDLENLQKLAARICFGFMQSYAEIKSENRIEELAIRRKKRAESFVRKALRSERFRTKWFTPREEVEHDLRKRRPYQEIKAKTTRYLNSPLAYLKRLANDLHVNND